MKIVAKTTDGYLVEASAYEIALLSDGSARESPGAYLRDREPIPMGTKFEVSKVIEHMHALNRGADNAKQGAQFMRGLADMLDKGVPDWIARPPEPAPEEPKGDAA